MKVKKTKKKPTYTLALSKKEAKLLAALVDYPMHSEQPEKISDFLDTLTEELNDAIGYDTPSATKAGFVNKTSVYPF